MIPSRDIIYFRRHTQRYSLKKSKEHCIIIKKNTYHIPFGKMLYWVIFQTN